MRQVRWLSVMGALCGPWTPVAMAEGTPIDCEGVSGEGIREMRALFEAEQSFLLEKDRYSQDLTQVGFSPAACADGSRAPVPGPGWVAGCHFAYQVTSVTGLPASSFAAIARGATGTPAEDVTLEIGSPQFQNIFFWLEHSGERRYVDWNECRPTGSFSTREFEGVEAMSHVFEGMQAYFAEKDQYPSTLTQMGFWPMSCTDGSRAPLPGTDWVAGCHFTYRVTSVTGSPNPSFMVIAQGAAGTPVADVTLGIGSPSIQNIVFWVERAGVRRFIDWEERVPTESVYAAQEQEGVANIRALFTSEQAIFQEKDRYSSNLAEVGFLPLSCTDGTRPSGPDSSWLGGCRFIYHVQVTGPSSFIATARAVSGRVAGTTLQIDETGTLTRTPVYSDACP
ncbi:hypothetical protein [Vitiosangium sp. GDMCC 1.1324]|uniref:hypothetical protein n=1 Tax=Vitiosangium sp. (strain GDMCC 1.1324) TaxID=2138576 RepID=UPI000D3BBDB4|nr:hypothetical protein [Vitiosangium sp. GDMCC 1.1324]PTL80252.1 hypothetical protein DAT35_30115 [Vitiosangium sp. GDMCC 1.1324]